MKSLVAMAVALAAVSLAACGGNSKSDKAMTQVCDARADISKQVDTLKGTTITTASLSQIQTSLKAIGDDLTKIKTARGNLDGDRKSQVDQANTDFESQVKTTFADLGKSTSVSEAQTQLQQAFQGLASSYQQTFGKLDCG